MYNARRSLLRRMERVMKKKIQNAPAITFRLNPELHAELDLTIAYYAGTGREASTGEIKGYRIDKRHSPENVVKTYQQIYALLDGEQSKGLQMPAGKAAHTEGAKKPAKKRA
jgi:hypothetical protein